MSTADLRKLVVHSERALYEVYIGRPSKWGNPFSHVPCRGRITLVASRREAVECFEQWLREQPELIAAAKKELKGKVLGCWCAPNLCHGDVLARIANE